MDLSRTARRPSAVALVIGLAGCAPLAGEAELLAGVRQEGTRLEDREHLQEPPAIALGESSTLGDYLAHGALNSPGLRAAYHRWAAAVEGVPQVTALPDPGLSFGYFVREVETRVGPQRGKVEISQMFPWKGTRRLRGDVAVRKAEAAHALYEAKKLALFHSITTAYWEYWYLARLVSVTEEHMKLLGYLEGVARARYAAGTAPHSAVVKSQVELGRVEERLASARDLRAARSAALSAAVGLRPGAPLPWPAGAPEDEDGGRLEYGALVSRLRRANPELTAAGAEVAGAEAGIALARRSSYPGIGVGLGYVFTDESDMGSPPDNGKDPVVAMFSVSLPVARAKYRAAEREAKARRAAALGEREEREYRLSAELHLALYTFRDAGRKIDLYRDTLVPKAKQSLEVTRQAFEAGRADFLDIIDAQRSLLEFELSHARARADRATSLSRIETLVGGEPGDEEDAVGADGGTSGEEPPARRPAGN